MFGFKKHCEICGVEVKKDSSTARFGKQLCSPEHAAEYKNKIISEEAKAPKRGGCCG